MHFIRQIGLILGPLQGQSFKSFEICRKKVCEIVVVVYWSNILSACTFIKVCNSRGGLVGL